MTIFVKSLTGGKDVSACAEYERYELYSSSKPLKAGEDDETELVLTPLRACWLWNAAGIDLSLLLRNNLKYEPLSNC